MRGVVRNTESWKGRRTPIQDPSTNTTCACSTKQFTQKTTWGAGKGQGGGRVAAAQYYNRLLGSPPHCVVRRCASTAAGARRPVQPQTRVLVLAARTLNAIDRPRVTLSPRDECTFKGSQVAAARGKGVEIGPSGESFRVPVCASLALITPRVTLWPRYTHF